MIISKNSSNEFYSCATFIDILHWASLYRVANFGLKMTLELHVRFRHLLDVVGLFSCLICFFLFLILHEKIYRNIIMSDHAKISGYTPEVVAKMLKLVWV